MTTASTKPNRKTEILDAAEEIFARYGFAGTKLDDIARVLDVSRQALLHHFSSKEALYEAVLLRLFEQQKSMLSAAFQMPCDTMFDRMENLNNAWAHWLYAHQNYAKIQLHNLAWGPSRDSAYWKNSYELRQFFIRTLKEGAARGEFSDYDINELFALTGAFAAGFLQLSASDRKAANPARAKQLAATLSKLTRALLRPE